MAGDKHQFIMGLVIRKMRMRGCKIKYVDGKPFTYFQKIEIPPQVLRHRPDIIGITDDGQVCIGEAKTENDITSIRTREQLSDFTNLELNGMPCLVIYGIPRMAMERFEKLLRSLGLEEHPYLEIIYVPEEIINEKNKTKF